MINDETSTLSYGSPTIEPNNPTLTRNQTKPRGYARKHTREIKLEDERKDKHHFAKISFEGTILILNQTIQILKLNYKGQKKR